MQAANGPNIQSASTLSGYRVRDGRNEDLGTIEEVMIDAASGRVAFAVLCLSGRESYGDRLFAVPWGLLSLNGADRVFVFPLERAIVERGPAFESEQWPDFADEAWSDRIHNHYGRSAAA